MNNIIEWCNVNQGFMSAILTVMAILINIIALYSSYKIGKIPYEKKLKVIPTYYEIANEPVIDVELVNYGISTLVLEDVSIKDSKNSYVGGTCISDPIILKPSENKKITFDITDYNGLIERYAMNLNGKMTIEVHEYGGRKHKFKRGFPVG